jgi:hypothetical protein
MFTSLLRDEPQVSPVQRGMAQFRGYLGEVRDILMRGSGLRGARARRTRAVLGHALAFPTWVSLVREQELAEADAVALMCRLVRDAA